MLAIIKDGQILRQVRTDEHGVPLRNQPVTVGDTIYSARANIPGAVAVPVPPKPTQPLLGQPELVVINDTELQWQVNGQPWDQQIDEETKSQVESQAIEQLVDLLRSRLDSHLSEIANAARREHLTSLKLAGLTSPEQDAEFYAMTKFGKDCVDYFYARRDEIVAGTLTEIDSLVFPDHSLVEQYKTEFQNL